MHRSLPVVLSFALLSACSAAKNSAPSAAAKPVFASVETEPVPSLQDAADDPAIWIHPTDPARSLIIGTDKKNGLDVYDLSGKRVQSLPDGRMNNVDLRYGFALGGAEVAIVAATNRTDQTLALYAVDADGRLSNVADGKIATGLLDPYGLCMYRSPKGEYFVFANDNDSGAFKQWQLEARGNKVGARQVREFAVGSQAEGCAADDGTGHLYIAEEDVGLWRYSAAPDGGSERTQIDSVANGHLTDDAEGVTIFYGSGDTGYVIVSSQGSNDYNVYLRNGDNKFLGKFAIVASPEGIDGTSDTDGIDVTSTALGAAFPHGVFVAQDGKNTNPSAAQNFKLVPWERIAAALGLPL
ncbi:phytase [Steroidobacter sp.]|uniref:phytase n=1 Tax=Steroidobacter sp. TaxID=1978227 RepID=UPI001A3BD266|nr:phytase [Steroidobacter sp.]MBL8268953.1 phytase [Steroidobacter sp.]